MQVLNTGTTYRIYDESMKAFNELPAGMYKINFDPRSGYSLIKIDAPTIDEKIYGEHLKKVDKVFNSFEVFPRNLGVILSGAKGIGKSLFAKLLALKSIESGYPIIMCDAPYPGVADFLGSIQQKVVILFDEFDKTFAEGEEGGDPQAAMLTLFDGLYTGKKMFVVTCNDLHGLNEFLVNRPGRFHYHFRFDHPSESELTEYLQDNVAKQYWSEIKNVKSFAMKVDLNYDCLRAIAFELNLGTPFSEAVKDLNIINVEPTYYDLFLYFKDGTVYKNIDTRLDIFNSKMEDNDMWFNCKKNPPVRVKFDPTVNIYDANKGGMVVPNSDIEIQYFGDDYEWDEEEEAAMGAKKKELEGIGVDFLLMKRHYKNTNIHYSV